MEDHPTTNSPPNDDPIRSAETSDRKLDQSYETAMESVESPTPNVEKSVDDELISNEFRSVDPRNVQVELVAGMIASTIVATAILVGVVICWFQIGFTWPFYLTLAIASLGIALMFLGSIYWPKWSHERTSYRVDEEGLEIRRGVIWRHRITIPLGRVQHADVSQGPIQRMFGIGTLMVHTAGTQNASIGLLGLEHELAVRIRDVIVHQRKGLDAV